MRTAATRSSRLLGLCALGAVGFNFPLITLWDRSVTVFGVPLMALALFAGWAVLIGAAAWIVERGPDDAGASAPTESAEP
ncbi:MAG: hypothetical protein OEU94_02500 [Aquincola sp.]|nr:hypothetical protein [Aquincola sp.]MDH4288177.1 hypothetical protein [Aquincola sp.]MDH5330246.1 hypothetical protein [Aquincola sp.]